MCRVKNKYMSKLIVVFQAFLMVITHFEKHNFKPECQISNFLFVILDNYKRIFIKNIRFIKKQNNL